MSGQEFGKELKSLRLRAGIGSKELSQKIGKAVTYVSQLERGLIKNPDYYACYNLLETVGFPKQHIDQHLETFGIISPQLEEHQLNENVERAMYEEAEMQADPDAYFEKWRHWYDDDQVILLKDATKSLHQMLDVFIDKDLSRASTVIGNMENLLASKQNFEFLCALFEYDFARLDDIQRLELLSSLQGFFKAKSENNEGEPKK
jgi:transcriptional regulator with XRE-family HTH domain